MQYLDFLAGWFFQKILKIVPQMVVNKSDGTHGLSSVRPHQNTRSKNICNPEIPNSLAISLSPKIAIAKKNLHGNLEIHIWGNTIQNQAPS